MRRVGRYLLRGVGSYVLAAAVIALLEYMAGLECPDCGGDGGWPHPCSTCGQLYVPGGVS